MGRELYETVPVFRQTIKRCEEVLLGKTPRPLTSLLYADPAEPVSALAPEFLPVASFAVQYALAEVWRSCGLEPALVLGTGTGECIAACCAGVVSMEDALLLLIELGKGNHRQAEELARQIRPQAAAVPWFAAEPRAESPDRVAARRRVCGSAAFRIAERELLWLFGDGISVGLRGIRQVGHQVVGPAFLQPALRF